MKFDRYFPVHPVLFSIYPVLAMLSTNIHEVEPWVIWRPLTVSIIFSLSIYAAAILVFRNIHKAAVISTIILLIVLSYGHVYDFVENLTIAGVNIGRHRYLAILMLAVLMLAIWMVHTRIHELLNITVLLNVSACIAILLPLVSITYYFFQTSNINLIKQADKETQVLLPANPENTPDIYYIILDMYARNDILQQQFGYNNSAFTDELRAIGFYVGECSRSNYNQTELSLASSMNMDYLQSLGKEFNRKTGSKNELPNLMVENKVRRQLSAIGYRSVGFETGYLWNQWSDADFYFVPKKRSIANQKLQPFESMLLQGTAASIIMDGYSVILKDSETGVELPYSEHINRQRYLLDQLPNVPSISGPKLVYAHILIPHFPFVFGADGNLLTDPGYNSNHETPINQDYFNRGYTNQVQYINSRIIPILRTIIQRSKIPPIIILQGDHGVDGLDRMAILNAYYFPNGNAGLYPGISPVNTFRLVFNRYFGTQYPLLTDVTYDSHPATPLDFVEDGEHMSDCLHK